MVDEFSLSIFACIAANMAILMRVPHLYAVLWTFLEDPKQKVLPKHAVMDQHE